MTTVPTRTAVRPYNPFDDPRPKVSDDILHIPGSTCA